MRQSQFLINTTKDIPKDAVIESHKLLIKSGAIRQIAAGVYTYMPLANRVLKNIENVVRDEMDAIGAAEIFMPVLQPSELWKQSNRWGAYGDELMTMEDRHGREFALGPTHEEIVTFSVSDILNSYKKLPITLYQIQTKFRDEMRPRFGLMRGREFTMKDAYSFNESQESLDKSYSLMEEAYKKIFERLEIEYRIVEADSGEIGGIESAEFMALAEIGEDTIAYSDSGDFAANTEICSLQEGDLAPDGGKINFAKTIEIGHIFKLGTKYSESFKTKFQTSDGKMEHVKMGCYGIGVSRLIMTIIEQHNDENGIIWPKSISPFMVHIIQGDMKNSEHISVAEKLYTQLKEANIDVLYDDRTERMGSKFADADLIGVPCRITVGRDIKDGKVELKYRKSGETLLVNIDEVMQIFNK